MLDSLMSDASPSGTVFVVDDDASVRRAMARLLASAGLQTEAFSGAQDFLSRAERRTHGCIILDVKMPDVTGIELQQQLVDKGFDLPVIFVTAHADVPLAVRAIKSGALEVFTKPFDDQALIDAVYRALALNAERVRMRLEVADLKQRFDTLTPRERTVMNMVVSGLLNKQIAGTLETSVKTVKVHRAQAMRKMHAESLADLVRMSLRLSERPSDR